jgi:hypothetical protein
MKTNRRTLAMFGLILAVNVAANAIAADAQQQPPAGQKTIQDPAEYAAYTAAVSTQDATARAEALEGFVQQYPKSLVLADALEQEMAAYQAAGDSVHVTKVARHLLAADPGNIRALGIVVSEGFCAVEQKNYSQARTWLTRAYGMDPTNVQDTYQLAVADLESTPLDAGGFWYCARAVHLAQTATIPQDATSMVAYCKDKYVKFHGADDGWDALVTNVAAEDDLPPDFAKRIKAAPATPQK